MKRIEEHLPDIPNAKPVAIYQGSDDLYRAEVSGKNILALHLKDIRSAIDQYTMHNITSNWTLMILLDEDLIHHDIKFMGLIQESGKEDRYVISDVVKDGTGIHDWRPSSNIPEVWNGDPSIKLIPYSEARLKAIDDINAYLTQLREEIRNTIFSEDCVQFLDDYIDNPDVIFDLGRKSP